MPNKRATHQQLLAENEDLRVRLAQAEEIQREMRSGEVDALFVSDVGGAQLFTLKDADQSFRILVEGMSEGALTITSEGLIVYANRRFAGMLKTPLEKVIGSTVRNWIAPFSQPIFQSLLEKGSGQERREELELAASDGTNLPVHLSVSNLPIEGSPDAYCLVAIDLTEHKRIEAIAASERVTRELLAAANQSRGELLRVIGDKTRAEKALAQESRRNQLLLRKASDGVHVVDADGNVLEASDSFCKMLDCSREEVMGANVSRWAVQWSPQELKRKIAGLMESEGRSLLETHYRRRDASILDVEVSVQTLELDEKRVLYISARDITERKRMETALRESEAEFRILAEAMPQLVWITRADGWNIYFNQHWMEYTGLTLEESLGHGWSKQFHPDDRQRASDAWQQATESIGTYSIESRLRRADGAYRWWLIRGLPLKGATGEILKWFGTCTDIHDLKMAQLEIARYVEQLQIAVMSTVEVATTLSEMRDPYTAGHERRVGEIAVAIGAELGFDARRQEGLRVAGHLHDVGKISIPSEILTKPGKISAVEFQLIQGHAQAGYDVLKSVEFPWPVAQVALQHHERMDGSGYPQGLKGEAILFEARIIAVADVLEATSAHRPYRPALGMEAALAEIKRGRGTAYDPVVADACLKLYEEKAWSPQ